MLLGPVLSVPVGFAIFTTIGVIIMMILSEITWKMIEPICLRMIRIGATAITLSSIRTKTDLYCLNK